MLKKLELVNKVYLGFGLLLGLQIVDAFVGFNAFSTAIDRVNKAANVYYLARQLGEVRRQEKIFVLRQDLKYANKVKSNLESLLEQAKKTELLFVSSDNKQEMQKIIAQINTHRDHFSEYSHLTQQNIDTIENMRIAARSALSETEAIKRLSRGHQMMRVKLS